MRNRCGQSGAAPASELVGPRLRTAEDAVAAIRMSAADLDQESIVVLVCDAENVVLLAVDFAGAPATGVCDVVDLVRGAALEASVLIVGLIRPLDRGDFTSAEVEAIKELVASCGVDEVCLRDILVITGDRWRSVTEVVINGFGENNGRQ